jgi:hypothetical protein
MALLVQGDGFEAGGGRPRAIPAAGRLALARQVLAAGLGDLADPVVLLARLQPRPASATPHPPRLPEPPAATVGAAVLCVEDR